MNSHEEILSFMDLLDLDEEVIDARLKTIMVRTTYSNKHLVSAIRLLRYKYLINSQEGDECDNDEECNFVVKLIKNINLQNIDNVCKITNIALSLNTSTIVSKSEHLIQQLLSNFNVQEQANGVEADGSDEETSTNMLVGLKLCESILDAVIRSGEKISLMFLDTSFENILSGSDDKLKIHFLTNTVPRLFEGTVGYNILDRIWNNLKLSKDGEEKENTLKVLTCLSEFYLPFADSKGKIKAKSELVFQQEFWNLLQFGLISNDSSIRKQSIYLMKRAIDYMMALKKDTVFTWDKNDKLKQMWDNFFILIESLEEKQTNIVLPSLQLFDTLSNIQKCWLNCALNIGLRHDSIQVRLKCIEYRLQVPINDECEAITLLKALNDINVYDDPNEYEVLKHKLVTAFEDTNVFVHIFKAIAKINWSPIPFYHLSGVLASMKLNNVLSLMDPDYVTQTLDSISKVPCNNIAMRNAIHVNILQFVGNCCKGLHWRELANIYISFKAGMFTDTSDNPFVAMINKLSLTKEERTEFFKFVTESHVNIDLAMSYLSYNYDDLTGFMDIVMEKIKNLQDIVNRQYCDVTEGINDLIFLTHLFSRTEKKDQWFKQTINTMIAMEYKTIVQYILCLLFSDTLSVEDVIKIIISLLFEKFTSMSNALDDVEVIETVLQLYKSAILLIRDNTADINKKVLSVYVISSLSDNLVLVTHHKHELLSLKQFLEIENEFKEVQNLGSSGKLRNVFYEKSCEVVYHLMKGRKKTQKNIKGVIDFVENVIECGGYGCLKWILKIMNGVVPILVNYTEVEFNISQFINRMWKEIEELKSNYQYLPCIEEFITLITQDALIKKSAYNNITILYCNKIIEYGPMKNSPLFYLVRQLNNIDITVDCGQLIYVLCEVLLYSPVPKKDRRITDNVALEILHNPIYGFNKDDMDIHFNFEIQYLSVSILCKIANPEILESIAMFIINKIDEAFKNRQRYHGNSQPHRLLLIGLQHLLLIGLLNLKIIEGDKVVSWCIELLGKLPHQPSIRICLEWFISLHLYLKKQNLNEETIKVLNSKNIPVISQFIILSWVLKQKIVSGICQKKEHEFVMDTLLSHTMGQMFNIRLHAQYLATKLNEVEINSDKYAYTIEIIQKTFVESEKDKNFVKLKEDFFANEFNIISDLTPCFIYYFLPRYFDIGVNESIDNAFIKNTLKDMNDSINKNDSENDFKKNWIFHRKLDDDILKFKTTESTESKKNLDIDSMGTIQKKYLPWKNMSDIDVYESEKKKESKSELIVVASLIDKLPNLGGMARTSEVFGVKTYVVDSLRHIQDKQFQGLSVSAERWVNIEEVRPGLPLKEYLIGKKASGYSVVAAEQTSTSCQLQTFKFPKKTLLLLGHEKEGIPCDLLPMMDHCVEIPQQGFVRSLNVHVTAAIFIWEYARQNIL